MKFLGKGFDKHEIPSHSTSILGLNCADKSDIRSSNGAVKEAFWHAGCYIFLNEPTDEGPGRIYVGQTRYFDTRFNSYDRLDRFQVVFLVYLDKEIDGDELNFSEAEIQHLEFTLIDAFKELCFNRNYVLENKQSGTPTVGKPSVSGDIDLLTAEVLSTLNKKFAFPLNKSTPTRNNELHIITAGMDHQKGGKQYRLAVQHDKMNHLFKVLSIFDEKRSQAIAADNAAYWHHKLIHRRLEQDRRVFQQKVLSRENLKCRGIDKWYDEYVYPLQDDWIAMNLSEIIGAFTNGPGPINWYDAESGELIKKSVIKTWNRGGPE